ncbi:MAG: DUF1549 and DUF1553 domain-containing protein [Gemmataceae bacterium]
MRILALLLGVLAASPVLAAPPARPVSSDDARRVAAQIDTLIASAQARAGVRPSALTDDAAFLRRISLDVAGKIPNVHEVRRFLQASGPDKRAEAIDRLLDSPGYINQSTAVWMELLVPETVNDIQLRFLAPPMQQWLRKQFAQNTPYDVLVREIVSLPMMTPRNQGQQRLTPYGMPDNGPTPMAFYQVKQGKPEELAASISRLFLGLRLECAQCHDHPFGKWKREEFWSQAAFFAGLKGQNQFAPINEQADRRELAIPNTDRVAQARFLDGKQPRWKFKTGARTTLAEWMTAKENPYLARALVNRMWAHFFGIGLVDPVDDLVEEHAPSHPEVLDLLAREFVRHDFDLKFLIRAITLTEAYQRASTGTGSPGDPHQYTRGPVKGLSADQLYDSLCVATGIRDTTNFQQRLYNFGTPRQQFQDRFANQERRTEYHSSIPQALTMMNNQLILDATHPDRGEVLGALVAAPFLSDADRIETLYLAALGRKPRPEEASRMLRHVEKAGTPANRKKALGDVFWVLLNSTEFKFNH